MSTNATPARTPRHPPLGPASTEPACRGTETSRSLAQGSGLGSQVLARCCQREDTERKKGEGSAEPGDDSASAAALGCARGGRDASGHDVSVGRWDTRYATLACDVRVMGPGNATARGSWQRAVTSCRHGLPHTDARTRRWEEDSSRVARLAREQARGAGAQSAAPLPATRQALERRRRQCSTTAAADLRQQQPRQQQRQQPQRPRQ